MKILFILLLSFQLFAQNFEGVIQYQAEFDGDKMDLSYFIKGENVKMKVHDYVEGSNTSLIFNNKMSGLVVLMDDEKMFMELPLNSFNNEIQTDETETNEESFVNTGETKEILGYNCEKYIINSEEGTIIIWATKELGGISFFTNPLNDKKPTAWQKEMDSMNFVPLEISDEVEGSVFKALKVDKKELDNSEFEIPAEYKKLDMGGY